MADLKISDILNVNEQYVHIKIKDIRLDKKLYFLFVLCISLRTEMLKVKFKKIHKTNKK